MESTYTPATVLDIRQAVIDCSEFVTSRWRPILAELRAASTDEETIEDIERGLHRIVLTLGDLDGYTL